jgi:hypothetical protein
MFVIYKANGAAGMGSIKGKVKTTQAAETPLPTSN